MKKLILSLLVCFLSGSVLCLAQSGTPTVKWDASVVQNEKGEKEIRLIGHPEKAVDNVHGTLEWVSCQGTECHSPEDFDYELDLSGFGDVASETAGPPAREQLSPESRTGSEDGGGLLWTLILQAVLWGFAMLLTPCVFPMVPMTVSFFLKRSSSRAEGRFKAAMYGLFIVMLYTLPICAVIGVTLLAGGNSVTADIFNWLSTHWLPNLLFFVVFMVFAASFFGAFELTLPGSVVNKSDKNSDKKGLAGVFFMALTLVLVSFSCTGPIVGTVLIKSTQGEFWTPIITMLAFSIAFALPFTVLALFPSLLQKLPKSGGWLNSVKVTLGFIELALGFKFLSVADQTYHWGILDREVYLSIWIVCFALLGFYLLGKIRFKNDSPLEHISVKRLALAIADFAFVVYLIPGMWGAPLKALSGYLPPLETQDFVLARTQNTGSLPGPTQYFSSIQEGLAAAQRSGKPVFVDITGHGCVNCREMEARVLSTPEVKSLLDGFVIVELYTDDKTPLPESRWIKSENGKMLKDLGRVNSYIVRERFGVSAQPNYVILSPDGVQISPVRGYDLDVKAFCSFLQAALDQKL